MPSIIRLAIAGLSSIASAKEDTATLVIPAKEAIHFTLRHSCFDIRYSSPAPIVHPPSSALCLPPIINNIVIPAQAGTIANNQFKQTPSPSAAPKRHGLSTLSDFYLQKPSPVFCYKYRQIKKIALIKTDCGKFWRPILQLRTIREPSSISSYRPVVGRPLGCVQRHPRYDIRITQYQDYRKFFPAHRNISPQPQLTARCF